MNVPLSAACRPALFTCTAAACPTADKHRLKRQGWLCVPGTGRDCLRSCHSPDHHVDFVPPQTASISCNDCPRLEFLLPRPYCVMLLYCFPLPASERSLLRSEKTLFYPSAPLPSHPAVNCQHLNGKIAR